MTPDIFREKYRKVSGFILSEFKDDFDKLKDSSPLSHYSLDLKNVDFELISEDSLERSKISIIKTRVLTITGSLIAGEYVRKPAIFYGRLSSLKTNPYPDFIELDDSTVEDIIEILFSC
jgi:hypothetical protein